MCVIEVEPPGSGDDFRARPAVFAAMNAGKRSVVLDLKSPSGLEALHTLVTHTDVLVENYRPGVTANLRIDWPTLRKVNSRLIYCSISGYGQAGPLRDYPAIEWAVQAMSGMAASYIADDADGAYLGVGVLDLFSGYVAFSAILAALLQRQHTGTGQHVDASMLDAALLLMAPQVAGTSSATETGLASDAARRWRATERATVASLSRPSTANGSSDCVNSSAHRS
jgi:crotonobetainyl-CoA:carnitine CoA-transferase CaiB-like acyl-CoA transferase